MIAPFSSTVYRSIIIIIIIIIIIYIRGMYCVYNPTKEFICVQQK